MKRVVFCTFFYVISLFAGSDDSDSDTGSSNDREIVTRSRGNTLVAVHEHLSTREGSYDLEAVRIDVEAPPVIVPVAPPQNTRSKDLLLAVYRKKMCIALIGCIGTSITAGTALIIALANCEANK